MEKIYADIRIAIVKRSTYSSIVNTLCKSLWKIEDLKEMLYISNYPHVADLAQSHWDIQLIQWASCHFGEIQFYTETSRI